MSNHGSIKKLNWQTPKFADRVVKSVSHDERVAEHSRQGTPPTRQGGFNGAASNLIPALPAELNPNITVNKAVLQPVKYGPGGPQFQRKRDPSGKFATTQQAGQESTAEEDKARTEQAAELSEARKREIVREMTKKAFGSVPQQVPGVSGETSSMTAGNDNTSQQLGSTKSGKPVFDDPDHSSHGNFGPEDHQDAMNLNNSKAQEAQSQGDQVGAAKHAQNAKTHSDMLTEGASPGDRFMDNLFGPAATPSMPPEGLQSATQDPLGDPNAGPGMGQTPTDPNAGMGQPPDMNNFMDLMGQAPAPMEQPPMDANQPPMNPVGQPPTDPSMVPNQPPMGQPPMDPSTMPNQSVPMQPPQDPLNAFVNPPVDQHKPTGAPPSGVGPAPGMKHTATGGPVGPQTEAQPANGNFGTTDPMSGQDPNAGLDLESLFETNGDEGDSDFNFGGEDDEVDSGFGAEDNGEDDSDNMEDDDQSNGNDDNGFGGNFDRDNNDADTKKLEATAKAISALRRYL
jgi:hypothetical protein